MRKGLALLITALGALIAAGCGDDEAGDPRYRLTTPGPRIGALPLQAEDAPPSPSATPRDGARAKPTPTPPSQADAERLRPVMAAWAAALRRGDAADAARFFVLPTIVSQGDPVELTTRAQLQAFNDSLPCGARLLEVQHDGRFVVGTFRLTERPDNTCDAPGQLVRVAFVFRGRRFSEWYQVPDARGASPGPSQRPEAPSMSERSTI